MKVEEIGRYDPYTDSFLKNTTADRIKVGTNGNLYSLTLSQGVEYSVQEPIVKAKIFTKDEVIAMFTEIQLEIDKLYPKARKTYRDGLTSYCEGVDDSREIIQQKINALKGEQGENTN